MAESVPDLVQRRSSFRPDALADAERGTDGEGRSFRDDLPLLRRVQLAPPLSLSLSLVTVYLVVSRNTSD